MAPKTPRAEMKDRFYWLGQINKASAIINSDEGLLDRDTTRHISHGLARLLEKGNQPGAHRPGRVIKFEPLLIEEVGFEATLLHAGRSSQDMHATASTAMIREETLAVVQQLHDTILCILKLAEAHVDTLVPNYTNGVAAQPNSYGHYLLGHVAGLLRDAERLQQFYARLDRCPMGSTVLNGTSWPLNRTRMAACMGFSAIADNAFDAVQISSVELPVELGAVATSIALHAGAFIQDIMVQYTQPRPWIMLREGGDNTYMSSAMPQKRNPGILNRVRANASKVLTLGTGRALQSHNLPPGMIDARGTEDNIAVLSGARDVLKDWARIVDSLQINRERALEELNSDWTASQEVADVLMRNYEVPFRVGHHFVSEVVTFARANDNIRPSEFSYAEARDIYTRTACKMKMEDTELPMSEDEFRETLDPAAIVRNRRTVGGPQPVEMKRMLDDAQSNMARLLSWVYSRLNFIDDALAMLDSSFNYLIQST